jgi:hypothetical protein
MFLLVNLYSLLEYIEHIGDESPKGYVGTFGDYAACITAMFCGKQANKMTTMRYFLSFQFDGAD